MLESGKLATGDSVNRQLAEEIKNREQVENKQAPYPGQKVFMGMQAETYV